MVECGAGVSYETAAMVECTAEIEDGDIGVSSSMRLRVAISTLSMFR